VKPSEAARPQVAAEQGLGSAFLEFVMSDRTKASSALCHPPKRLVIEDVATCEPALTAGEFDVVTAQGIRALVALPLTTRTGEPLGVFAVGYPSPRRFAGNELQFLDLAARMAADFVAWSRVAEQLHRTETRLRAMVAVGGMNVYWISPDWLELRPINGDFFGQPGRLSATWLHNHVHPDDHLAMLQNIATVRETGEPFSLEHRIIRGDGEVRWVHSRAIPVRNNSGAITEWFGMSSDISEQRAVEAELRQSVENLNNLVLKRTMEIDAASGELHDDAVERGRAQLRYQDLLRQLSSAQEIERRRISRELHDQIGQLLAALLLGLADLSREVTPGDLAEKVKQLGSIAQAITSEVHSLAVDLRPTSLDDLGLARALAAYVERWAGRTKAKVDFHSAGLDDRRFDPEIETSVYRIVQEALNNVLKHAQAKVVSVILACDDDEISAIVEDDGIGFDFEHKRNPKQLGLLGMNERAQLVGGEVVVESSPGQGTTVLVRVPIPPVDGSSDHGEPTGSRSS
jgi:signal transduction histidine kinase